MVTGQKWSSRLTQEPVRTEASPLSPYHNGNEAHPVILKEWRQNEKKVNRLALSTQHARGVLLSFRHNREVSTNHFQIMAVERKEVDRLPQGFSTH